MALIPSGYGWSADESFMKQTRGLLGSLSGLTMTGATSPEVPVLNDLSLATAQYVWDNGFKLNIPSWEGGEGGVEEHIMSSTSGCLFASCPVGSWSGNWIYALTSDINTTFYVARAYRNQAPELSTRTFSPNTGFKFLVTGGTVYYWDYYRGTPTSSIPVFTNQTNLTDSLSIGDTSFYKHNNGYVAGVWLKWRYMPMDIICISPILISTESLNTVMSNDDVTVTGDFIVNSHLFNGVRFTMRYSLEYSAGNIADNVFPIQDISNTPLYGSQELFEQVARIVNLTITDSPDPYEEETDPSEEDGGGGDDVEDNPVEEETLPLPSVAGLGFCTIYVPSDTDLLRLSQYLWGGNLDLENFLKLFANPMDSILGLSAVPVSLPGTSSPVYMGGQILENITLPRYTGRTSVKVNMGTMSIKERWGSYLDYDPYTELSLYLPFIGIKNIKADDVMGKTISLTYSIDIISGACVAYIRPVGESVLYEWSGQCAMQIPITGQNWDNVFATATATAVSLGAALFSPSAISAGAIASTAVQAVSAKPRVERSGAVSGISGFLGQMRPYLIRVIPDAYIPNEQNKFIGYPSFVTKNLGTVAGYNEIASIHLEGIPATGNELSEIETLLKGGVIF